jgi:cytochrome c-type biogenesis protein CcsB
VDLVLLRGATVLYLTATVMALAGIAGRHDLPGRLLRWLLGIAIGLHGGALLVRAVAVGNVPVTDFSEALSFLALLLVVVFLLVQMRAPLVALGAVVSPLAFGLTFGALVLRGGAEPLPPTVRSGWLPVHVGLSSLGDAVFALAFSSSLLYLLQERRLKQHRNRGALRHLPSLEALDRVSHTCLKWGLVLQTLGIVSGIVLAHEVWVGGVWARDPTLLFTLFVWVLYVVLLQGRMTAGWRGRWAAQLTIAGFAVLVISLVGVNVLGLGIHSKAF